MSGAEIKQKQASIDSFTSKAVDSCMAAGYIAIMLISVLLGYEAFVA